MRAARSGLHYELRTPAKDSPVIEGMKDRSCQFPRFGARRIHIFLDRQGTEMGRDRCSRIWSAAGLQVPPRKKRRKHLAPARHRPMPPKGHNSVWCYDFVFDSCANGQQLKCLTVVDEYTRECLAIDVVGSIRSKRIIDVLSQLISVHGAPRYLRSDNGPEFVSLALLRWVKDERLESVLSVQANPGKTEPVKVSTANSEMNVWQRSGFATAWKPRSSFRIGGVTTMKSGSIRVLNYRTPAQFIAGLENDLVVP